MAALHPVTQTVLILIGLYMLTASDLIVTSLQLKKATEDNAIEEQTKFKKSLNEKINLNFFYISIILLYFIVNFTIFMIGHHIRN